MEIYKFKPMKIEIKPTPTKSFFSLLQRECIIFGNISLFLNNLKTQGQLQTIQNLFQNLISSEIKMILRSKDKKCLKENQEKNAPKQ